MKMTFTLSLQELRPLLAEVLSAQIKEKVVPEDIDSIRDPEIEGDIEYLEISTLDRFTLMPKL
jgi:hypothetical protein